MTFKDLSTVKVNAISVSSDITSGDVIGKGFQSWPTKSIREIQFRNAGKGFVRGFLGGLLMGGVIGYMAGNSDYDRQEFITLSCHAPYDDYTQCMTKSILWSGVVFAVPGGLLGAIIGFRNEYVFGSSGRSTQPYAGNLP